MRIDLIRSCSYDVTRKVIRVDLIRALKIEPGTYRLSRATY